MWALLAAVEHRGCKNDDMLSDDSIIASNFIENRFTSSSSRRRVLRWKEATGASFSSIARPGIIGTGGGGCTGEGLGGAGGGGLGDNGVRTRVWKSAARRAHLVCDDSQYTASQNCAWTARVCSRRTAPSTRSSGGGGVGGVGGGGGADGGAAGRGGGGGAGKYNR